MAQLCLSAIYCGSMFRAYALAAFGRTTTAAWSKYQACTWQQVSGDAQRPHTFLIPLYTRYGLVGLAPAPTHLDPSERSRRVDYNWLTDQAARQETTLKYDSIFRADLGMARSLARAWPQLYPSRVRGLRVRRRPRTLKKVAREISVQDWCRAEQHDRPVAVENRHGAKDETGVDLSLA